MSNLGDLLGPGGPAKGPYNGPRAPEWVLALALTILVGQEVQTLRSAGTPQSAVRYYFENAWVNPMHVGAVALDVLLILIVASWIFWPRFKEKFEIACAIGVSLGFCLAWVEIVRAVATQPNGLYILRELPIRPVNNLGLIGSQVFLTYMVFKIPTGKVGGLPGFALRVGIACVAWMIQTMAYDALIRR